MARSLAEMLSADNALIFRITHRDNVAFLLHHGVHCRNSPAVDPAFIEIGHPEIIGRRSARIVDAGPRGVLADYVPFYFTPRSPMLYNIVTGWNGLRQRSRSEVVVLLSSLDRLDKLAVPYVVADRNATLAHATIRAGRELLGGLPWADPQRSDFKHNADRPEKVECYQAEALVHRLLPIAALLAIITYDDSAKAMTEQAMTGCGISIPVKVRSHWYP